ncbi:MAG: sulfotransferase [Rhodospirillaceae bacterium]|nr:MAG: sulfotransferase [Rhodospirillaceae bacterium]
MAQKLVADKLIEDARRATGLDRFDSESFREGLEILISDVNRDNRPDAGVEQFGKDMVTAMATRLKVVAYLDSRPELLARPVKRPVFVLGIPRTGTTLLSNLLAADPGRRSALTWEIDDPVPPATSTTLYTDPRAVARLEIERQMLAAHPEMGKLYRNSAIYPNECVFIMAHDFKTLMWESRGKLQTYRDWIFQTDVTSAYEYHKRFLQLLQADAPGTWNLKMPSHALYIPTLLKVYPDARLIWTHRDPYTAASSLCSLISNAHKHFVGKVDVEWLGQNYPWQAAEHANRAMDARDAIGEDRIIDVHYAELMRDPIKTMRGLYGALGDEFTPAAEAGMRAWISDNPQGKFGRHEYKLAQYGLSVDKLKPLFERYLSRYDVELEG